MKYISLATEHRNAGWYLHPITGSLHQINAQDVSKFQSVEIPQKVLIALEYCHAPYNLTPPNFDLTDEFDDSQSQALKKMYERILFLRKMNYWFVKQYACFTRPLFNDSLQAFSGLAKLNITTLTDSRGCLNRTMAVAKSSIEFKKSGVLFIGADLPHTSLHAWIIENNYQPDPWDRDWINYLPIAAYTF